MNRIGRKILLTYFAILMIAFLITDITFLLLSSRYLVNDTRQQLYEEGQSIAGLYSSVPLQATGIREKLLNARKTIKIAGRIIDADIVILGKDGRILFRDTESFDKELINELYNAPDSGVKGYVSAKVAIIGKNGELKGYVLLFTRVKNVYALSSLLRKTQFISFAIAGLLAFIIGAAFAEKLVKPLKLLMGKIRSFSVKKMPDTGDIMTGDEIEELDRCFKDMAGRIKEYNEQQIRFLQNTSHELKTPLMSIQGYAEAIKDGIVEGAEAEESLDIIIEQCRRLKKTVEDIIYLTKLENIDENFDYERISLDSIIEAAVKSVKPLADEKNIKIIVKPLPECDGDFDEEKMVRAFINILGNGIRYAESCIAIEVSSDRNALKVVIEDDGPGLQGEDAKRLFERFYKGEKGNLGLGLSITKAIVEGHKGKINAYNSSSKGAVFEIILPNVIKK